MNESNRGGILWDEVGVGRIMCGVSELYGVYLFQCCSPRY